MLTRRRQLRLPRPLRSHDPARSRPASRAPRSKRMRFCALLTVVERVAAWRNLIDPHASRMPSTQYNWPGIAALSAPLLDHDFAPLLRQLRGKIEPDGSLSRRRLARTAPHPPGHGAPAPRHRREPAPSRSAACSEGGSTQDEPHHHSRRPLRHPGQGRVQTQGSRRRPWLVFFRPNGLRRTSSRPSSRTTSSSACSTKSSRRFTASSSR